MDQSSGKTGLRHSLERAASGGPPSVGQWMEFPGYTLARTVASTGCDWVLVDCEHGNIDDSAMYHGIAAIVSGGASPVVRIAGSEPWMVKRALDAGAHGIMVPMCETVVRPVDSIVTVDATLLTFRRNKQQSLPAQHIIPTRRPSLLVSEVPVAFLRILRSVSMPQTICARPTLS